MTPGSSTTATTAATSTATTTAATSTATTAATIADQRRRAAVADAALVIPDRVRLQLDTALFGQRAPLGSTGPDAAPRSKNLTLLVGTLRTRTTRSGRSQREISDLGAVRYRYELSINELFASPTGMAYASYRFPITMTDAVLARCADVLVDGQRVAVLGPITLDVSYDPRFQTDAYDVGLRTWTLHMDVLDVRPAADDLPDMAWVQLEGEVIDRPWIVAHRYGDRREMVERYASVSLRCRELLAGPRGVATRPVTRVVPIEVLIDPYEELISASDALLQPGNLVRVEGRFSPSTYRIRSGQRPGPGGAPDMAQPDEIAQALERTRMVITARNAELRDQGERYQEALQAAQERNRARTAAGRQPLPLPAAPLRPLSDQVLEQRIIQAQRRLLTGTRVRVEVGAVELLRGTPLSAAARAQLIADREAEERSRRERRSGGARPALQLLQLLAGGALEGGHPLDEHGDQGVAGLGLRLMDQADGEQELPGLGEGPHFRRVQHPRLSRKLLHLPRGDAVEDGSEPAELFDPGEVVEQLGEVLVGGWLGRAFEVVPGVKDRFGTDSSKARSCATSGSVRRLRNSAAWRACARVRTRRAMRSRVLKAGNSTRCWCSRSRVTLIRSTGVSLVSDAWSMATRTW